MGEVWVRLGKGEGKYVLYWISNVGLIDGLFDYIGCLYSGILY